MEELETEGRIAGVVSSEEVEGTKPAPDIFGLALKRAGSEETVAVGDSVWEVEAAKEAGVRTVAVLTGGAFSRPSWKRRGLRGL